MAKGASKYTRGAISSRISYKGETSNDLAQANAAKSDADFERYKQLIAITTFIVSQNGVLHQKDLGPDTNRIATTMTEYNPDSTWQRVH